MALFSRPDLPGVTAPVRDIARDPKSLRKLAAGDIVVIDGPQISLGLAQRLIETNVAAVATVLPSEKGNVPRFGPQLLIDSGVAFIDGIGEAGRQAIKSGKKYRLDDGVFYKGENELARGEVITLEQAVENFQEARELLVDHMEALSGNLTEFVRSEAPLFIDGLGIPEVDVQMNNLPVVIVSPGPSHKDEIKQLKRFIREQDAVLIGVESAADSLLEAGYKPQLVVGDPEFMSDKVLRSGATVILPADPDGHAAGLERIQDLGVGAMTFPAATTSATDMALLLASYHGASIIVNAGAPFDITTMFDESQRGVVPSALLTRELVGSRLVDSTSMAAIYQNRRGGGSGWGWALVGIVVMVAVIVAIAGFSGDQGVVTNLIDTWNSIVLWLRSLWS